MHRLSGWVNKLTMPPEAMRVLPAVHRGLQRAKGLRKALLASIRKAEIQTYGGLYLGDMPVLSTDSVRLERVASRIIQGLFYHEKGRRLPEQYEVEVFIPRKWAFERNEQVVEQFVEFADYISSEPFKAIGEGVFSYKFRACDDDDNSIIWGLIFYESITFIGTTAPRQD